MYDRQITDQARARAEVRYRAHLPHGLREYSVGQVREWQARLAEVFEAGRGRQGRELTAEEEAFIWNERVLTKIDFRYWAERYAIISHGASSVGPLYPLWESQEQILERLGQIERQRVESGYPEAILVNCLKARQLGNSTIAEAILAHRLTTHADVFALTASDEKESSAKMFRMFTRIVEHLPWWLAPGITDDVKNQEMAFANGSRIEVEVGNSTRGAEGRRGQLGRSGTYAVAHLSELSTWENAAQIDDAFLPTIPYSLRGLVILESTGKGVGNWWHRQWERTKRGQLKRGFENIFIPWYAERTKYRLPAPTTWIPKDSTLVHARRCEATSPQFFGGKTVRLTREQMYWYERTRDGYESDDALETFLEEYAADDVDAFQMSGRSVFSALVRQRIQDQARPLAGVIEIRSRADLAMTVAREADHERVGAGHQ